MKTTCCSCHREFHADADFQSKACGDGIMCGNCVVMDGIRLDRMESAARLLNPIGMPDGHWDRVEQIFETLRDQRNYRLKAAAE